nr:Lar family restriction alleviation protein [Stenotrophomonas geniculata]
MSEIELKACPFCGRKPRISDLPESAIHVSCGCGASLFGERHHHASHAEAAARWNTRAPQWQAIESAPKDGTFYLATNGKDQRVENCPEGHAPGIWHRIDGDWRGVSAFGDDSTHWQPLPAPPEVEG